MKYKALFLDLDGTAVTLGSLSPTHRVKEAVLKADKILSVCLATGRILKHALPVIDTFNLSGLCVISNGIQIYDPGKKSIIEEFAINQDDLPYLLEILRHHDLSIRYFDGETDMPYIDDLNKPKILSLYVESVNKELADAIISELRFLPDISTHQMIIKSTVDNNIGLEIANIRATKQHGILEVAKRLGIGTHEIIGVGDGYNDFPLLMACGLKIAMGNAVPELKAIADFIAPTVEDDGVATVIEKFILHL